MSGATAGAVVLCVAAGLAGSVQAAVMGKFGERIGILEALAFSTVITMAVATAALVLVRHGLGGFAAGAREPGWLWLGGVMSAFIVLSVTVAAPRIGITATIGLVIVGNLAMAAVIDRYGLFGLEPIALDWTRVLGLGLLAAGAALSLSR